MEYIQVTEINSLPPINEFAHFKAVLAIENSVSQSRQIEISQWMVEMGALYVMICGESPGSWSDSIRQANIDKVEIATMTAEQFVMITEHETESLRNVFWHAKKYARHTHAKLENIVVIHISNENRAVDYLSIYNKA